MSSSRYYETLYQNKTNNDISCKFACENPPVQPEELSVGILCMYLRVIASVCRHLKSKEKGAPQNYCLCLKRSEEKVI